MNKTPKTNQKKVIRKTYGETVNEVNNTQTMDDDVTEYRGKWEKDILTNIYGTIDTTLKDPKFHNKDFYICVLFKVEKLGQAPRSWTFARHSCPTPIYNQNVWKYHRNAGTLEFLWAIPNQMMYYHVLRNAFNLPKECHEMAKFVTLMESGELLNWVKKENGEKPDAVIKETKEPECLIIQP